MQTIFRLFMVAAIAGAAIWFIMHNDNAAQPSTTVQAQAVAPRQFAAPPPNAPAAVAAFSPLRCDRAALRWDGVAAYQMDGPLGMAQQIEIDTWHSLTRNERVEFFHACREGAIK